MSKERDYFLENLSTLISAGLDVLAAMRTIKADTRSPRMKKIIAQIEEDVDGGSSLHVALENAKIFSPHVVSLIKIGESSGRLMENLGIVALEQQQGRLFQSKIRSAMLYPAFVLSLSIVVGVGISWFILPRLVQVLAGLNTELPTITRVFIAFGDLVRVYGQILFPAFLTIIILIVYFFFIVKRTKFIGEGLLFVTPGIKKLIQEIEIARFGSILGALIEAGLPVVEAIGSFAEAASFHQYKKFYFFLKSSTEEGNPLEKSFALYRGSKKLIPHFVQQLVVSGERGGKLGVTLQKIGTIFAERADISTKNLASVLEPLLLIIVWLGVMFIALAVILPIYGLLGSIR